MKNKISHSAIISEDAKFGKGNVIKEGVIIRGNVVIGDNNIFEPYCVVGKVGECKGEVEPKGTIIIGDNNHFHEGVSIHSPVRKAITIIGDNNYLMNSTHIAHDCKIGNHVTIAPMTILGGVSEVGDHSNLGMAVKLKPRAKIGRCCMVGMGAVVTKDVPDYQKWAGVPARQMGYNIIGMQRLEMGATEIKNICAGSQG